VGVAVSHQDGACPRRAGLQSFHTELEPGRAWWLGWVPVMSAYIKRIERSQINDLILQLKLLEKQEQANPKTSRRREIIKIKAEINEIETKKPYKESMKQKAGSLKK
jgi:hypothetical protein